jgi:hypothetical protein
MSNDVPFISRIILKGGCTNNHAKAFVIFFITFVFEN